MAAIDPNAARPAGKPPAGGKTPSYTTLKLVRRPLGRDDFQYSDDEDEDESEDEDEDDYEVEMKKIQQKAKKVKKQAAAAKGNNEMDVDGGAGGGGGEDGEDEDSDGGEPFETEEFVICSLNPQNVCHDSGHPQSQPALNRPLRSV